MVYRYIRSFPLITHLLFYCFRTEHFLLSVVMPCLKNHLTAAIYTSALKIVPLVVRIYSTGFVKCFDAAVFCSFWISPVRCDTFYCFKCIVQSLNFRFWQVSQNFDYTCTYHFCVAFLLWSFGIGYEVRWYKTCFKFRRNNCQLIKVKIKKI